MQKRSNELNADFGFLMKLSHCSHLFFPANALQGGVLYVSVKNPHSDKQVDAFFWSGKCLHMKANPTHTSTACHPATFTLTSCRLWENTAHVSSRGGTALSETMGLTDAVLSSPRSLAADWSLRTVRTVVWRYHISNRIAPRCRLEMKNPVWRAHTY